MGNVTENVLFKSFRRRIKKERKLFLFVLTFALYTFVLHADWWFQKLINSSPTTTKMFFDGHYKMMIRTNFICSDGKPFSFLQKMLNLYTTETSSNVTCEYWMNTILELQSSRAGPGPSPPPAFLPAEHSCSNPAAADLNTEHLPTIIISILVLVFSI